MDLPVMPHIAPMLAKAVPSIPSPDSVAGGLSYEPKWDGFRCLLYRDGDEVVIGSRDLKDLTHCFPEVVSAALKSLPDRVVVDGELIIERDGRLDFEALGTRIRPKSEAGRPSLLRLAEHSPATLVAFDLLSLGNRSLLDEPFGVRRAELSAIVSGNFPHLSPHTLDAAVAAEWFERFEGAGLDGLVCKPLDAVYSPGQRTMLKVKHARTADVVVAGWREHKTPAPDGTPVLGSLLLGAFDDEGRLHHLGVTSAFTAAKRAEFAALMRTLEIGADHAHPWVEPRDGTRVPGGVSRWTGGKDLSYRPVRTELVAEVRYDNLQGDRFRHTTHFVRWRPDREPESCTYEQFPRPEPLDLSAVFTA